MMNGGTGSDGWMNGYGAMGGYGGIWVPALLVIAVVGLVAWIVTQKRK
jgi:ABC-type cobalamin transport system permease subunit